MMYPVGYGAAEHRRALDALLADLAAHGQKAHKAAESKPDSAPKSRVIAATVAPGHCRIDLRVHPESAARL